MHIVNSQVWQAVDGQIFLREEDCRGYEDTLISDTLYKLIVDADLDGSSIDTAYFIAANFDKIKRIMQTGSAEEQQY